MFPSTKGSTVCRGSHVCHCALLNPATSIPLVGAVGCVPTLTHCTTPPLVNATLAYEPAVLQLPAACSFVCSVTYVRPSKAPPVVYILPHASRRLARPVITATPLIMRAPTSHPATPQRRRPKAICHPQPHHAMGAHPLRPTLYNAAPARVLRVMASSGNEHTPRIPTHTRPACLAKQPQDCLPAKTPLCAHLLLVHLAVTACNGQSLTCGQQVLFYTTQSQEKRVRSM